jgi:NarL family two-component system response regulator LiaR
VLVYQELWRGFLPESRRAAVLDNSVGAGLTLPGASGISPPVKRVILYGLLGGVLIALLKVLEYQHFVRAYPSEIYGGLVAVVFAGLGLYFGLRWSRPQEPKEVVVVKEVQVRVPAEGEPFVLDAGKLKELGITQREHEILGLIAEGLSNREIGERLFVSENTVKTHSSRLFDKLGVNRRVQAVLKGRELGLIP